LDDTIALLERGGFRKILLRGDTDFTQTAHLDAWHERGNVRFVFGMDAHPKVEDLADQLPVESWKVLERRQPPPAVGPSRAKPANVKEEIVRQRGYTNITLVSEDIAEIEYRPAKCRRNYRLIIVRKNLSIEEGQPRLFDDKIRHFYYLTNDTDTPAEEIVFLANDRCNQENLIAQLKGGVKALHAPLNTLNANWAYMVMTALAWNLKAWWALLLPEDAGRWGARHREEKQTVLRMEFKRFAHAFIWLPCQIVRGGRQILYRLLAWNPWQHVLYRLARVLRE
jgi:hypothetical protein